jgi:hypothetical protein
MQVSYGRYDDAVLDGNDIVKKSEIQGRPESLNVPLRGKIGFEYIADRVKILAGLNFHFRLEEHGRAAWLPVEV